MGNSEQSDSGGRNDVPVGFTVHRGRIAPLFHNHLLLFPNTLTHR
jgi:hypothetical protein